MSHYRDLNKELVEQVQTMRVNMKLYCDEIISLKAELMQKYESELFLRKYCYNWAIENCLKLIQTIEPDSDILPLLKEHARPETERISRRSSSSVLSRAPEKTRTSDERSSGERRRSTQLVMEFQRSNSIINTRPSVRSISPIRRSNSDDEEEQEENDKDVDESDKEQEVERIREEETEQASEADMDAAKEIASVIYEESEEEEQVEDENVNGQQSESIEEIESVYESVEEITLDNITKTRTTLNDITNTGVHQAKKNNNSISKVVRKRGRPKKIINTQENTTDTDTDMEISVVISQQQAKRVTDNSVRDIENTTLQEPRRNSNARSMAQLTNKSIPTTTHNLSRTYGEVTLASPVSVDITMKNFKDAASSTPNSRRNSLRKPTTPPSNSTNIGSGSESGTITTTTINDTSKPRPSRRCKPKVLIEPNLSRKLRNEHEFKTKSKGKSKTKK